MIEEGSPAPDATYLDEAGEPIALSAHRGRPLVLYFYPRDDTSGCTSEAQDFSALLPAFATAGVAVLGISRDTPRKHAAFKAKHGLTVPLGSDPDGALCEAFGTWVEKSMYGRTHMGIERATFLIDADGRIVRVWRKVRVKGHADSVLQTVCDAA